MIQPFQRPPLWNLRDDNDQTVSPQTFLGRERLLIALQPSRDWLEKLRVNAMETQLKDYDLRLFCLCETLPTFKLHSTRIHLLHDTNGEVTRQYIGESAQNVWILVGNDATIKQIWRTNFSFEAAFALIDTMPMRQRELRERGN